MGRVQDRVVIFTAEPAVSVRQRATHRREAARSSSPTSDAGQRRSSPMRSSPAAAPPRPSASTSRHRSQVRAMIEMAVYTFGALNVIFNNAGMNRPRDFMDVDEENFESIRRVNTWV